jgi:hypothetical protein
MRFDCRRSRTSVVISSAFTPIAVAHDKKKFTAVCFDSLARLRINGICGNEVFNALIYLSP